MLRPSFGSNASLEGSEDCSHLKDFGKILGNIFGSLHSLTSSTYHPLPKVLILKHRKKISCKGRFQDDGKEFTNSEDSKVEDLDVLNSLPMENIPKSLWPLLMSAAEAEMIFAMDWWIDFFQIMVSKSSGKRKS